MTLSLGVGDAMFHACYVPASMYQVDRQTLRPMDDTDRGHRGAYLSTAAVPPRCLASLVAVTDTYDGYERCSLTDSMDMYTCMSDNQYHCVVLVTIIISRARRI